MRLIPVMMVNLAFVLWGPVRFPIQRAHTYVQRLLTADRDWTLSNL